MNTIAAHAARFFPFLERFAWGVDALGAPYVVEGVDFLPEQALQLAERFGARSVFLGNSEMTAVQLKSNLGRQPWLAGSPPERFEQMAEHIVDHTKLIRDECARLGLAFVDMAGDFEQKELEAAALLER